MSSEAKIEAAREVATWLDSIGEHKRANDVRSLCRSNDSLRVTCGQLSADNLQLRGSGNATAIGDGSLDET